MVTGASETVASGGKGESAGSRAGPGIAVAAGAAGVSVGVVLSTTQPAAAREQSAITNLNVITRPILKLRVRWAKATIEKIAACI